VALVDLNNYFYFAGTLHYAKDVKPSRIVKYWKELVPEILALKRHYLFFFVAFNSP
jgi:hypothetical protein